MEIKNINLLRTTDVSYANQMKSPFDIHWAGIVTEACQGEQIFREHSHDFFEILFILEGECLYEYEGRAIRIQKNQFAIIPPKTKHTLKVNSESFVKLVVCFSIDASSELYENFVLKKRILYNATEDMLVNIRMIIRHIEISSMFYKIVVSRRLEELIYLVVEDVVKVYSLRIKSDCPDIRLLQAKKYIMDNPDKFLSCAEVASYCYLSKKQLGRLFDKYEHMSVLEFIHQKKLSDIIKLIKETNLTQKEISQKLGFATKQYYNTFFKKNMGITPAEYRLKYKDMLE